MRFNNARQAVHDAFASNLGSPDPGSRGGTKYNADNAIAHQAEAGLIIRAALEQKSHLRAMCLFVNAPEGTANEADFAALKSALWRQMLRQKKDFTPMEQGRMAAMVDYVLIHYRSRCHNAVGDGPFNHKTIAEILRARQEDVLPLIKIAQDILTKFDNESLQPVWHVVNEQREKYDQTDAQTA